MAVIWTSDAYLNETNSFTTNWSGAQTLTGGRCTVVSSWPASLGPPPGGWTQGGKFIILGTDGPTLGGDTTAQREEAVALTVKFPSGNVQGQEIWFAWETGFVDPAVDPTNGYRPNFTSDWNVFTQWHQGDGITTEPIGFEVKAVSGVPTDIHVVTRGGPETSPTSVLPHTIASFAYGWWRFKCYVKWGQAGVGRLKVYAQAPGESSYTVRVDYTGPVGYNPNSDGSLNNYFKQGMYRNGYTTNMTIYHAGTRMGTTEADVDPLPPSGTKAQISWAEIETISQQELNYFGQGSFGVLKFGTLGAADNVAYNARITGQASTLASYTAKLTASASTSVTENVAITSGAASSLIIFESRLTGQAVAQSISDARVTGSLTSSVAQDARVIGQDASSRINDVRLASSAISSAIYDARLTGRATSQTALDARLTTVGASAVAYDSRVIARATTSVIYSANEIGATGSLRTQDARLTAAATSSATRDARVTAQLVSSFTWDARISGQATTNVSKDVKITSQAATQVAYDVRLIAQAIASQVTYDVRQIGQATATLEFGAFIGGQLERQVAVPIADNFTGTWHDTPLYPKIASLETVSPDYIESGLSPVVVDIAEVQLTELSDPLSSDFHTVRYVYAKSALGGDRIDLVVRLMQGATQIAAWGHTDIGTITEASHLLSGTEADSITDYGDLRLRFEAIKV